MRRSAFLVFSLVLGAGVAQAQVMGGPPENFAAAFEARDGSLEKGALYANCRYEALERHHDMYLFIPRTEGELTLLFFHRDSRTVGNIATIKMANGKILDVEPLSGAVGMAEEMRMLAVPLLSGPLKMTYDLTGVFAVEPDTLCGADASTYFKTEAVPSVQLTWWRRLYLRWNQPKPE